MGKLADTTHSEFHYWGTANGQPVKGTVSILRASLLSPETVAIAIWGHLTEGRHGAFTTLRSWSVWSNGMQVKGRKFPLHVAFEWAKAPSGEEA